MWTRLGLILFMNAVTAGAYWTRFSEARAGIWWLAAGVQAQVEKRSGILQFRMTVPAECREFFHTAGRFDALLPGLLDAADSRRSRFLHA